MFTQYLIAFYCLFAMVFSVPLTYKRETEDSDDTDLYSIIIPAKRGEDSVNYETLGGGFEGDMVFPNGFDPSKAATGKGAALYGPRRWPNNVIPYDLSGVSSTTDKKTITDAMHTLMYAVGTPISGSTSRRTCVYFREKTSSDANYLRFVYGGGCSATPGYWPGYAMTLTLAKNGCFYSGIIQHELMHALGFYHEQSRPDRDSYVTVNYGNIQSGMEHNFAKYVYGSTVLDQKSAYDYGSLMHYGAYDFSRNGQPTIQAKKSGTTLGQRDHLSTIDIAEIRAYYSC